MNTEDRMNQINVKVGVSFNDLMSGLHQIKAEVSSTAKSMTDDAADIASKTHSHFNSTKLAYGGLKSSAKMLMHQFGVTGVASKVLGSQLAGLVFDLGAVGLGVGLASLAVTAGMKAYEHFAEKTAKLREEQEKLTEAARKWILEVDIGKDKSGGLWKAEYNAYLIDYRDNVKLLGNAIKEAETKLEALRKKTAETYTQEVNIGDDVTVRTITRRKEDIEATNKQIEAIEKKLNVDKEAYAQELKKGPKGLSEFTEGHVYSAKEKAEFNERAIAYEKWISDKKAMDEAAYDAYAMEYSKAIDIDNEKVAAEKRYQEELKYTTTVMQPFFAGFNRGVLGMINGTMTLSQATKSMAQSVIMDFAEMGLKAMEAALISAIAKKAAGVSEVSTAAGVAGAGTTAALAPAGPEVAVPAGIAVSSTVLSTYMPMLAAAQGFDVPAGMSPITRLHEREMVLPANLADRVRGMSEGGGSIVNNWHISAIDGASVRQFIMRHGAAISDALKQQQRNFRT